MKGRKTIIVIISFFIITLLALITFYGIKVLNTKKENDYLYKIHYFEDYDPGRNHYIYVYDNYDILVISQQGCSAVECVEGTVTMPKEEKNVIFSEEGKEFLKEYFENLFKEKNSNSISLDSHELNNYESIIIYSIISNTEEELNSLKKSHNYEMNYRDKDNLYYYKIYLSDKNIKITKSLNCAGCNSKTENYELDFSEENMKIVIDFITKIFSNVEGYKLNLNSIELSDNEKSIVDAIILNDESRINSEYLFIISDSSCDCIPNFVYFYLDKTYVVKGTNDKVISEGEYELDPKVLINELKENEDDSDDERGMNYYIELYNGDKYWIRHDNKVIKEFLKDLDIDWY